MGAATSDLRTKLKSDLAERLRQMRERCGSCCGLYTGKIGVSLCYFECSRILGDTFYSETGMEMLNEVYESIGEVSGIDFSSGLTGIGWGIEWLGQNRYLSLNTDKLLEDFDDQLYQSVVYSRSGNPSLESGTLGKAMYFFRRVRSQNRRPNRYRYLCNFECLAILIDELSEFYLSGEFGIPGEPNAPVYSSITSDQITGLAQCLAFSLLLLPYRIRYETVEKLIRTIRLFVEHFDKMFVSDRNGSMDCAYGYLLSMLQRFAVSENDVELIEMTLHSYKRTFALSGLPEVANHMLKWMGQDSVFHFLVEIQKLAKVSNYLWKEAWLA
jgi:hypothetical protein